MLKRRVDYIDGPWITTKDRTKNLLTFRMIIVLLVDSKDGKEIRIPVNESIVRNSRHFQEQIKLLDEKQQPIEIVSKEDNIYEATGFLMDVTLYYLNNRFDLPSVVWNSYRAKLSTKWMFDDFVKAYSLLIKRELDLMISESCNPNQNVSDVECIEVKGATTRRREDYVDVNGIYYRYVDNFGLFFLKKELDENGLQWMMEYSRTNECWDIKEFQYRVANENEGLANEGTVNEDLVRKCRCSGSPARLPTSSWTVREMKPGVYLNECPFYQCPRPQMKVRIACSQKQNELFWSIIEATFEVVGLRFLSPIKTIDDLNKILEDRPDLRV
jgi:hypothetical protein